MSERGCKGILRAAAVIFYLTLAGAAAGGDVSGRYYDWTKTRKPERPYIHAYDRTLVMKIFLCAKGGDAYGRDHPGTSRMVDGSRVYLDFGQALEVIRKLDALTLGMPKIVYLVGWQFDGHDSKYPDWSVVNPRLKRPQDRTALESLKWLMAEGFKYHTTVSLHVNMFDAYEDSPLWPEYTNLNIVARAEDGSLIKGELEGEPAPDTQIYNLSYAREWQTGLAQKRIDGLLAMLPIQRAGTIHLDAFHSLRPVPHAYPQEKYPNLPKSDTRISPFLNIPLEEEVATQRKIFRYFRDKGVDVTSEGSTFLRPDAFVGLQPMAWDYVPPAPGIPPSLYDGTPMRAEPEIRADPVNLTGLRRKFCLDVVPWYFTNNAPNPGMARTMREGDDICLPALWRKRTLVAYSGKGCAGKTWPLPSGWGGVRRVRVSEITLTGPNFLREIPVEDGAITLRLEPDEAVAITAR